MMMADTSRSSRALPSNAVKSPFMIVAPIVTPRGAAILMTPVLRVGNWKTSSMMVGPRETNEE